MNAKQALERSEQRLQLMLRGSNDGSWDTDLENDRILHLSPRWCAMVGWDAMPPGLTSTFWRELCHPNDLEYARTQMRTALGGNADIYNFDLRLRHVDGHYVPVNARGYILRNSHGRAVRVSGVTPDLSERARIESDRVALAQARADQRTRAAELEAAEHARLLAENHAQTLAGLLTERNRSIAERDELVALLAHEVRQPLHNASAALLSQPDGLSRQEFEIDVLLDLALADLGPTARKRAYARCPSGARTGEFNVALMRLALRNLLVNALNYSPPESTVQLTLTIDDAPLCVVIEVAEEGPGISQELMPTLFERGSRGAASTVVPGAGLGLYVVSRVVALHHGTVSVMPRSPQGTLFRVMLPQGDVHEERLA